MLDVADLRFRFPALQRLLGERPPVFFDGPAGSQVPAQVGDAVAAYLGETNANTHGSFATSLEVEWMLHDAAGAVADLLGAGDPEEIAFGPNMTTLTLGFSRALGHTWGPGDEVLVTRQDHDANVWPWVLAARDAGATVRYVDVDPTDCTLDLDDLDAKLSERTRLVAVGAASNAVGTVQPVGEVVRRAHAAGAEVFVDAVHFAPHRSIDVGAWDWDYLVCSAYKFFGPHVGILWGRRERLEAIDAYRVRPAGEALPGKWMTGTQSHEGIAGVRAAIGYLASLGEGSSRRACLEDAFAAIEAHERDLAARFLDLFERLPGLRVLGIDDRARLAERVPTFGVVHDRVPAETLAKVLGAAGIFCWSGDFYAVELIRRLGLEPHGMLRIGALHYNTVAEIDRLGDALEIALRSVPS